MTDDLADLLRAHGLRVTPQRRAILEAFEGSTAEHLSADEVHARAAAAVPEIGRGTVYAALAELTELGLLAAHGNPEPVRYETNTAAHHHFRCRLCLRLFDIPVAAAPDTSALRGFTVERVDVVAGGICAACSDYDGALRKAARRARARPSGTLPSSLAAAAVDTPAGSVTLAATPEGLVRVVFDSHADAPALLEVIKSRRGGRAARAHVSGGLDAVRAFFERDEPPEVTVDWSVLGDADILRATQQVHAGSYSYDRIDVQADSLALGRALGANPLAIVVPCHRVTQGVRVPDEYVGGAERRRLLRTFELSSGAP